jgi:hypothetical protein
LTSVASYPSAGLAVLGRSSFRDSMRVGRALDPAAGATDYEVTCARLISAQPAALGEEGLPESAVTSVSTRVSPSAMKISSPFSCCL